MAINMHNSSFTYNDSRVLSADCLTETGLVRHGFSTRVGGTSEGTFSSLNLGLYTKDDFENVRSNFALFCNDVGVDPTRLAMVQQVHSTKIVVARASDCGVGLENPETLPMVDGLVTNEPGVCLATFCADCTPILMLDPVKKVIASVHSGWRGTLGQIVAEAVRVMVETCGSVAEHIVAVMGPSIKQCHFEVDEDVYLLFRERFGTTFEENVKQKGQKYYIDTDALNRKTLLSAGLLRHNIHTCPICTYCDERFFSHRRDGETGRMCAMIELKA